MIMIKILYARYNSLEVNYLRSYSNKKNLNNIFAYTLPSFISSALFLVFAGSFSSVLFILAPSKVGTNVAATEVARLLYGASIASCIIPKL